MGRRQFLVAGTAGTVGAVLLSGPSMAALLTGPSAKGRTAAATQATTGQWTAPFKLGLATGLAAAGDTVWVASTASGTLSRIDARRPAVVATVRVGVRPYAVAADRQGAWVAVLGQPVMDAPPGSSGSLAQEPAWLLRLCGVG